jgi:MATE family multidrug resistance protein
MTSDAPPEPGSTGPAHLSADLRHHALDTIKLATPAMFARAGILMMAITDTLMVGRYGAQDLAYLSLGLGPQLVLMMVGIGIMQGGIVMTAQAYGAREYETCGKIWRVGLMHGVVLGVLFAALSFLSGPITRATGIDESLAAGAQSVAAQFAWGMPGMLLYVACNYMLEGIRRPRVGMIVMGFANLLNIALNVPFIFGFGDLIPAMGATGAVAATSIVRWFCFLCVLGYILVRVDREKFGIMVHTREHLRELFQPASRALGSRIRRLGTPMGVSQAIETSAMAGLIFMAGNMGAASTAAHQVSMNIVQLFYMMAIGMAAAASVRVGIGVGEGDLRAVRLAAWTAIGLLATILIPVGVLVANFPLALASLFTSDAGVLEIAAASLFFGGILIAFNGVMNVLMGSLRGTGDVWVPMGVQTFSFWVVAVPSSFYFGFRQNLGAPGLILGLIIGVLVACILLGLRFTLVSSRPILRR